MGVRERILALRLMDKVYRNPTAAEKLGIVVINGSGDMGEKRRAEVEECNR